MSTFCRLSLALVIVSFLISGCGSTDTQTPIVTAFTSMPYTDTPVPPTATEAQYPTATSMPPTTTNTLVPTETRSPTATPTPTRFPLSSIGGGMIAFASDRDGDFEIYLMELPDGEGGDLAEYQLTDNADEDSVPDWSPDGAQIAFASDRDGNWEIYTMDASGGDLQRLTDHESDDLGPAWSPDGAQIAFSSNRDGNWEIYVMDAEGDNLRRLTNNPGIDMGPSWSPDGTQIAFDSGEGYLRHVFIMDADGSNQRLVTRADGGWPAWSPDGTQIAFFGRIDGNPEIYVVNTDGTNQRRMTNNGSDDWEPSWSPDGEWLLFVSGQLTDIFAMRADGSVTYRLTHNSYGDWVPVWRPSAPSTTTQIIEGTPVVLSEEDIATLSSLTQVDDYPLYVMHYYGGYHQYAYTPRPVVGMLDAEAWGCSLFAALGDPENLLFGRNFDYEYSPGLLLFTDPPDGYASVSMQSVRFMRNYGVDAANLMDTTLEERFMLLYTPLRPYDGMNEKGLGIGMAAVPSDGTRHDPAKEDMGMISVMRQVLDYAASVDEAVEILGKYNIIMEGGPPIHYLVADATGRAVLVEFYEGEMLVFPSEQNWHTMTNFFLASAGDSPEDRCWRYDRIATSLAGSSGRCSAEEAMRLLGDVTQESTQWSVVYKLSSGEISVVMGRDYGAVHTFQLGEAEE